MGREIEHKYLVRSDGWRRSGARGTRYRQGYLSTDPERSVRVRLAGDKALLTIKGPSEGASRDEFEYPIPTKDAEEILERLSERPIIEKTRYVVEVGDRKWEIDEFHGANAGLCVAELETEDEASAIAKPDWVGEEVTSDARYFNASLVHDPYSKWGPRGG